MEKNMITIPEAFFEEITVTLSDIRQSVRDIASAIAPPKNQEAEKPKDDADELEFINPKAMYDDSDLCRMLNVSKSTTQRWRSGSKIKYTLLFGKSTYLGLDIIKFIRVYGKRHRMSMRSISKIIPEGTIFNF